MIDCYPPLTSTQLLTLMSRIGCSRTDRTCVHKILLSSITNSQLFPSKLGELGLFRDPGGKFNYYLRPAEDDDGNDVSDEAEEPHDPHEDAVHDELERHVVGPAAAVLRRGQGCQVVIIDPAAAGGEDRPEVGGRGIGG